MTTGQLFYDPIARPLSSVGVAMPGAYYNFYVSGSSVPAPVYQDAGLTLPWPAAALNGSNPLFSVVQADGTGAMPPIFLVPTVIYRVQLYTSTWNLIEDVDPYVPSMPVTGNGQIVVDAEGEVTIAAPTPGGTGITFAATNKPGSGTTAPTKWLPITCDGATYYIPLWQ
jgi:hypothetical protein